MENKCKFKYGEYVDIRDGFFDEFLGVVLDYDCNQYDGVSYEIAILSKDSEDGIVQRKWMPQSNLRKHKDE